MLTDVRKSGLLKRPASIVMSTPPPFPLKAVLFSIKQPLALTAPLIAPPNVALLFVKLVFTNVLNPSQHQSAPPPLSILSLNDVLAFGFAELLMKEQLLNVQFEWCLTAPPATSAVLFMKVTFKMLWLTSLWFAALIAPPFPPL